MKIVIVGNGVAGVTCAMTARQRDPHAEITIVGGETDYFFSRTALMYSFMDRMTRRDLEPYERKAYAEQRIALLRDWVIDHHADAKTVHLSSGTTLHYDKLVLALGATPNRFGWEGINDVKDGLVHFVSMQDLDACERLTPTTREAIVVGGGLIGIELVESLLHHGVKVTFLIREPYYWPLALGREEGDIVTEQLRAHGVQVRYMEEMKRIEVDAAGRVSGVLTNKGETIPCQMLGICVGVRPSIDRLKAFTDPPQLSRGVVVDETLQSSLPDVFACGDCAEIQPIEGRSYVEMIWYSAKRQGRHVAANLFGDQLRYAPPIFFNSSKFFEVEYTTVGEVMSLPEGTPTLFRKHPTKPLCQRILHNGDRVLGFNMLGSRWNHEILERWIRERRSPAWVVAHLADAQFDVEFGRANLASCIQRELPLAKELAR
ncbi:MAG: NAD(P)/FAD-dependent oxidoreductase [Deltaproteobacteria bacterium]|nr:NAD(P)/FAD-dependent oxidoreductase [Deltaproteobacteria bacterium]